MTSKSSPSPATVPEYHHALRPQPDRVVRSTAALGLITGSMAASLLLVSPLSDFLDNLLLGTRTSSIQASPWTPGLLISSNILSAIQIPVAILVERYIYNQPPNSISSTSNRFRWEWLSHLAKRVVPIAILGGGLLQFVAPAGRPRLTRLNLAMSLLTAAAMPWASAAEEFIVRGPLQRITASWFSDSSTAFWVSTGITGAFFASIHVSKNAWMNAYCLLASVCSSLMTRWTGGLEASVLLHSVSNVALLVPPMMSGNLEFFEMLTKEGPPIGMAVLASANVVAVTWLVRQVAKAREERTEEA